jgi:signal peptidase
MTDSDNTTADSTSTLQDIPWGRIANVAGLVLLIAIAVPFLVHAVPQVVGAEHSYVVTSGSMEPAMSPGDVIVVNSVAAETIEEGDVITYGGGGEEMPTTHRVIDVTQQDGSLAFETKGDANEDPDGSLVTSDEVQGRVMTPGGYLFVIPYIGYVIDFAGTLPGFIALFAVPIGLLVLMEMRDFVASTRSDGDDATGANADQPDEPVTEASGAEAGGAAAAGAAGNANGKADAANVESGDGESSDGGITFTAAELQLGLFVLVAFLAYSVWVSYQTTEVWALAVTGGVGAALLLIGWLYLFGGGSDAETDESGASGSPPDATSGSPAPAASEALGSDGENGTRAHAADIDPEVEAELLKHIIRRTDGGDPSARIEELLSDDASTSEAGGAPPKAGMESPEEDRGDERSREDDRMLHTGSNVNGGEHGE